MTYRSREEDEIRGVSSPDSKMRKIEISSMGFSGIAALKPGVNRIRDAWIEVSGMRVSEVEVGKAFDVFVDYVSENIGGNTWLSCVTVASTDTPRSIQNYEDTKVGFIWWSDRIETTVKLDKLGKNVMPNKNLRLRIQVWMHDHMFVVPPHPPIGDW